MKNLFTFSLILLTNISIYSQTLPVSTNPSNQKVLLETFTSTAEGYSPTGHIIADSLFQNSNGNIVWVNIASNLFSPLQNTFDLRTTEGTAIEYWMNPQYFPSGSVQRTTMTTNDTILYYGREFWAHKSDSVLSNPAIVNLAMNSNIDLVTRELTVNIELFYTQAQANGTTHFLNVGLLQDNIEGLQQNYLNVNPSSMLPNGNYLHKNVFRGYVNTAGTWGDSIDASQNGVISKSYSYIIPPNINNIACILENLKVFAFIQNGHSSSSNSKVLNAVYGNTAYTNVPYVNNCQNSTLNANVTTSNVTTNCNGNATVNVSGGEGYHTVLWTFNNAVSTTIDNLCNGVYNVIITDSVGCSIIASAYVNELINTSLTFGGYVVTSINTNDSICDGQAHAIVYGGIQPYTYLYSNGSTSSTAINLCPGINNVTVQDAIGNSIVLDFLIVSPENYLNNNLFPDSTVIDSIYNGVTTNCNINYSNIDSVVISSVNSGLGNILFIDWTVYYDSIYSETLSTSYIVLDTNNGLFSFVLQAYCPNKSIEKLLVVSSQYYVNYETMGLNEAQKSLNNNVVLFPNPFNDFIEISLEKELSSTIVITDVLGKQVLTHSTNSKNIRLDVSNLVKGQYFITVSNANGVFTNKVIK
ncbi:MAG: T9SS type A sorting domain-containing protein [Flavobacteriia bacterium]|nr:T9SS type A sorting domain-containing protein [Flavobacteriia bacterium]